MKLATKIKIEHMSKNTLVILFLIFISTLIFGKLRVIDNDLQVKPKKYVAFSADTEAYFTPRDFEQFQGEFTQNIIDVCEKYDVPFTWLIIVDKEHIEIKSMAEKHFPNRKKTDEFSLHSHFKWFIMDYPDDFTSFKIVDRRIEWLKNAKEEIVNAGLPMPRTFRYGGGDSQDKYYCIEDIEFLIDEFGIRNFLFSADRLREVKGIKTVNHLNNNIWDINGGRQVTLLSTCVYLDQEETIVKQSIEECLNSSDYAIIGCHDYRENVPVNLEKAIKYINNKFDVEYVTIDQIGELVRKGIVKNINK